MQCCLSPIYNGVTLTAGRIGILTFVAGMYTIPERPTLRKIQQRSVQRIYSSKSFMRLATPFQFKFNRLSYASTTTVPFSPMFYSSRPFEPYMETLNCYQTTVVVLVLTILSKPTDIAGILQTVDSIILSIACKLECSKILFSCPDLRTSCMCSCCTCTNV